MIDKIVTECAKVGSYVYDKSMSGYEFITKVMEKLNEVIDEVNSFQSTLDLKENSSNITNSRKLDNNGNFTGTWFDKGVKYFTDLINNNTILIDLNGDKISSNQGQINFLVNQFDDGATGLVIDSGFFDDDEIDKNYDGGVW